MQKLKNRIIDRMLEEHLTGAEIDLLLHMSQMQDDSGRIYGVYYRDVCEAVKISYETFYTSMEVLEQKHFIKRSKEAYGDSDVTILDNVFTYQGALQEGYVDTGRQLFYNSEFYRLKAGEKLLALQFFKNAGAGKHHTGKYHIGINKFYNDYMERLQVKRRTLQQYLKRLKKFFLLTLSGGILLVRNQDTYEERGSALRTDKTRLASQLVRVAYRRNRIADPEGKLKQEDYLQWTKEQQDAVRLIETFWPRFQIRTPVVFLQAIRKSLERLNEGVSNEYKWQRLFKPKLVNRYMDSFR